MKIVYMKIEMELDPNDLQTHATIIEFRDGLWTANGPMYSRITGALHEIWKLIRGSK